MDGNEEHSKFRLEGAGRPAASQKESLIEVGISPEISVELRYQVMTMVLKPG